MSNLEKYKIPESILKKLQETHLKILPEIERHNGQRKNQTSGPSLRDR